MDFRTIWEAVAGEYPKTGDVVGERRVITTGIGTDVIVFTDAHTGAGAWFTNLSEWREYETEVHAEQTRFGVMRFLRGVSSHVQH